MAPTEEDSENLMGHFEDFDVIRPLRVQSASRLKDSSGHLNTCEGN